MHPEYESGKWRGSPVTRQGAHAAKCPTPAHRVCSGLPRAAARPASLHRTSARRDVEVGEEIEIVDDTPVDDDRMGTVVGHQIAAVRGEMRMVFVVDMHLLPRVGREQNQQQQSRIESFGCVAYHLSEPKIAIKKGRSKRPCKNTLKWGYMSCPRTRMPGGGRCGAATLRIGRLRC